MSSSTTVTRLLYGDDVKVNGKKVNDKDNDNDVTTVSTAELLDLIESDIVDDDSPAAARGRRRKGRRMWDEDDVIMDGGNDDDGDEYEDDDDDDVVAGGRGRIGGTTPWRRRGGGGRDDDPFRVRLISRSNSAGRGGGDGSSSFLIEDRDHDDNSNRSGGRGGGDGGSAIDARASPTNATATNTTRRRMQRMPLWGGYGGMFDDDDQDKRQRAGADDDEDDDREGSSRHRDGDGAISTTSRSATSKRSAGSKRSATSAAADSVGSIFTMASRLFRARGGGGGSISSKHSYGSRSGGHRHKSPGAIGGGIPVILGRAMIIYASLSHRARQYVQLLSVVGIIMLGSMNYLVILDVNDNDNMLQQSRYEIDIPGYGIVRTTNDGRGRKKNRLRFRDPMKFLHTRNVGRAANALFDRAREKLKLSTRYDGTPIVYNSVRADGGGDVDESDSSEGLVVGPFAYGWKSMPRQVYGVFSTGLSDDTRTIDHPAERNGGGGGDEVQSASRGTVAYVIAVTSCYGGGEGGGEEDGGDGSLMDDNVDVRSYVMNYPKDEESFRDFALMLRANVHANSHRNPSSGSVYDYEMHAIVHPRAKKCPPTIDRPPIVDNGGADGDGATTIGDVDDGSVDRSVVLQNLGYKVSVRESPITNTTDVVGSEYLRNYLYENVGDQVPDLIRLYAYELEEYDAVAFVDFDTLIIRPVDEVVDLIVDGRRGREGGDGKGGLGGSLNGGDLGGKGGGGNEDVDNDNSISAVFSWEHLPSLVNPEVRSTVINLSFFLIHPSKATFDRLLDLYQNAPFSGERGWGDHGRGSFPGWMSTLGLLTYYYDEVANAAKVEMNRCSFGNTAEEYNDDNSVLYTVGGRVDCGQTGDENGAGSDLGQCRDCSKSKFEDVSVADLSYCHAPWDCGPGVGAAGGDNEFAGIEGATSAVSDYLLTSGLCRKYRSFWFSGRLQMEDVHPQLQLGGGQLCFNGQYQPMILLSPNIEHEQQ